MNALVAHNPKFASKFVTFADLQALPDPAPRSARHQPIRHDALVTAIHTEATNRSLSIVRQQFALGAKGAALFGVLDLVPTDGAWGLEAGRGLSFGFRASNDGQLALKGVAGNRVFVCDNLALSGDIFVMRVLHLIGLDLAAAIAAGFDRFTVQTRELAQQIAELNACSLTDAEAKARIYDVFAQQILPAKLFDDVHRFYFQPADDATDCHPRTVWGVHNAMTRAVKDLSPTRAFAATIGLGKALGLTAKPSGRPDLPGDVPDGAIA